MERYSFEIVIILISLAFAAVTILLGRKLKHRPFLKYIPAIVAAAAAAAFIVKAAWFSQGFEGLGYAIFAMIAVIAFIISIITAVVMEIINRRGKRP